MRYRGGERDSTWSQTILRWPSVGMARIIPGYPSQLTGYEDDDGKKWDGYSLLTHTSGVMI